MGSQGHITRTDNRKHNLKLDEILKIGYKNRRTLDRVEDLDRKSVV